MEHVLTRPSVFVGKVVSEHKGVRRGLVVWATSQITWVTHRVFTAPASITAEEAAAYATTASLLGVVLGLYFHGRSKEECQPDGNP